MADLSQWLNYLEKENERKILPSPHKGTLNLSKFKNFL